MLKCCQSIIKRSDDMRLLFNAAVIPSPGRYEYTAISKEQAAEWLKDGYDMSFIGYPATAEFIEKISGKRPELCRERFEMQAGDEALIVKLKYRMDPDKKGIVDPKDEDFEFGILKKLE